MQSPGSDVAASPPPEVPVTLYSLLELNRAYQELVQSLIKELEAVKLENKNLNKEVDQILRLTVVNQNLSNRKIRAFSLPYFVDAKYDPPPASEEKLIKSQMGFPSADICQRRKWCQKEYLQLQENVFKFVRRDVLAGLLKKKSHLDLKMSEPNPEDERDYTREQVQELNLEMRRVESLNMLELLLEFVDSVRVDWLCIAATEFDGKRTDDELELMWKNYIWPSMKCTPWDTVAAEKLQDMAQQGCLWTEIAISCDKTVYICLEKYFSMKKVLPKNILPEDLLKLYNEVKEKDYVPWVKIGSKIDIYESSRVRKRVEHFSLMRTGLTTSQWTWRDDISLLIGIFLFRGINDWRRVRDCVATKSESQCGLRCQFLLKRTSLADIASYLAGLDCSREKLRPRGKTNMIEWLCHFVMSVIQKVKMNCYLSENQTAEVNRAAQVVARRCKAVLGDKGKTQHLKMDQLISRNLTTVDETVKELSTMGGLPVILETSKDVILKNILGIESVDANTEQLKRPAVRVRSAAENILKQGLVLPNISTVYTLELLLERVLELPASDVSDLVWVDDLIETYPELQRLEQHLDSLFSIPLLLSTVNVQEPVPLIDSKEKERNVRTDTFSCIRKRRKPWITAMWMKKRAEKAAAEGTCGAEGESASGGGGNDDDDANTAGPSGAGSEAMQHEDVI